MTTAPPPHPPVLLAQAIADTEQRTRLYETFLNNTPDLAYVFDLQHRFIYANSVLLTMWGKTWEEAIGKTCLELGYEPWHADMHNREIDQVVATKQPITGEVPFHGTFGRRIYDYIFVPVLGPDGQVEAVAGTTRDTTDRKHIEETLRHNQAHLNSLFEQTSAGIYETDLNGRLIKVNQRYCKMLGKRAEDLLGTYIQSYTPDDIFSKLLFSHLVETGMSFQADQRFRHQDGGLLWTSTSVSLIRKAGDMPADTILTVAVDITERKQAEQALLLANQRKDEFLAMLAHELRNPLAPISAAAQLIGMQGLDQERLRKSSEIINRQVVHMVGLVDDLLDVSRVTRGLVTIDQLPQGLKAVITDSIEQVRPLMESMQHRFNLRMCPQHVTICGDQKRLVQILTNLLNNAAKYTPAQGEIALDMQIVDAHAVITITDNGIGIAADVQPHIFELFAQAKRNSDRSQGGLGIGLALVQSMVELHGGSIDCQSDGLGQGTRFTVRLPIFAQVVLPSDSPVPEMSVQTASSTVLVVDDNVDGAEMLASLLEMLGYDTIVKHSAMSALQCAETRHPQICIFDIGLPEMDGNELARRIRALPETANALLIAVTGYGQEQDRQMALQAGFDHHMVKPVEIDTLTAILAAGR